MAPRAGFEPATYRLGGGCSIRLSYRGQEAEYSEGAGLAEPALCPLAYKHCTLVMLSPLSGCGRRAWPAAGRCRPGK